MDTEDSHLPLKIVIMTATVVTVPSFVKAPGGTIIATTPT